MELSDDYGYINIDDSIINYQGEVSNTSPVGMANQYIEANIFKVNTRYRHTYHACVPIGWMNDPNGFIYAFGEYHLFYQFNPYETNWGPMHWGHYSTKDLVKWKMQPVALAPDKNYDKDFGAFSGTAINHESKLYLMYTGTIKKEGKAEQQQQCLSVSSDGIYFTKIDDNPVITTEQIPDEYSKVDFRDPKIFKKDDMFYCIIGEKSSSDTSLIIGGQLLLYKSIDMIDWEFTGALFNETIVPNGVLECPDIFMLDGKDIIICSPQNMAEDDFKFQNSCSSVYFVGNLDLNTGEYTYSLMDEIDSGFDFYAAQTLKAPDGRVIMTAWMNMWDRTYPSAKDGWVGAAILPRELTLKDGKIYQSPVKEIEAYRKNSVSYTEQVLTPETPLLFKDVNGDTLEIELLVDLMQSERFGIKLFKGNYNETVIYYDRETNLVYLDRSKNGENISGSSSESQSGAIRKSKVTINDNILKMRIFLDKSSVEVFLQDGERTMTATIFPSENDKDIQFFTQGSEAVILKLNKHDIVVK